MEDAIWRGQKEGSIPASHAGTAHETTDIGVEIRLLVRRIDGSGVKKGRIANQMVYHYNYLKLTVWNSEMENVPTG